MSDCTNPDLFGWQGFEDAYPDGPAPGRTDTSQEAAEDIAPYVGRLQALALAAIKEGAQRGMTTNEIATALDCPRDSIQPRTSELRARKLIVDSGQRRLNANGKRAIVWVAPEYATPSIGGAA